MCVDDIYVKFRSFYGLSFFSWNSVRVGTSVQKILGDFIRHIYDYAYFRIADEVYL